MKKHFRSIFSLVLSMAMAFCLLMSTTVYAAGDSSDSGGDSSSNSGSTNPDFATVSSNCVAWDLEFASGFGTTITLHLDHGYYEPYFIASAAGNGNNHVYCTVTTPTGSTYPLGTITANGSSTSDHYYTGTAPAGDYVFTFDGIDPATTGFAAFIYCNN